MTTKKKIGFFHPVNLIDIAVTAALMFYIASLGFGPETHQYWIVATFIIVNRASAVVSSEWH